MTRRRLPTGVASRGGLFAADLVGYRTGKGTVALPYDDPPPEAILRRMIEFRIREYERDGVKWM